jgi:transcription-repair coupling factor (superfamily II helicase)
VPEAKIGIGHGQMGEDELERAMLGFVERRFDVLLATTIVENGLDIPNANTIIINRADRYGLSQLYQLRGRVGRSDRPAYAYLLTPPQEALSPVARKRLAAIKEFSDLGSGFRVAALDLEIRGAGNLLGGEQSGHIDAVGFDMYMKLLEESVRELKGEDLQDDVRAMVNLRVDLKIDEQYVPDMNQRLMVYRKVASARTEPELNRVVDEIRDRYGALPSSVLNPGRVRTHPSGRGPARRGDHRPRRAGRRHKVQAKRPDRPSPSGESGRGVAGATLVPPVSLKLSLDPALTASGSRRPEGRPDAAAAHRPGRRAPAKPAAAPSWWTARATAGK